MNEIIVDKIVIPEQDCRCGKKFFVATIKGEEIPRTFHQNPTCPQLKRLSGLDFLKWVRTGEEPPAAPTPNRRQRRAAARAQRRVHA
jgi:hypothetical protein